MFGGVGTLLFIKAIRKDGVPHVPMQVLSFLIALINNKVPTPLKQSKSRGFKSKTFFKKVLAHPKSMCYCIADEGSACPTSNSRFWDGSRRASIFLSKNMKGQKTMATCMLRNNLNSLKALNSRALGFARSFVRRSISHDYRYDEGIKDFYGRLRC